MSEYWYNDSSDLVMVIAAVSGCLSALIAVWCQNQRLSRCTQISLCCGILSCKREIESPEELAIELASRGEAKAGQMRQQAQAQEVSQQSVEQQPRIQEEASESQV